jgi:cytochrome P450
MSTVAHEPSTDLGFDLSTIAFWQDWTPAERDEAFATLRRERPISWWGQVESLVPFPPEWESGGYWALTRYEDIRRVSRDAETFSSGRGVMFFDAPPEMLEATLSFIAMDAPRHTKLRGLVASAFTPRRVAHLEERIAACAADVVSELLEQREGDFVQVCAKQLPMRMIAEMIGTGDADKERLQLAAEALVSVGDPEFYGDRDPLMLAGESIWAITQMAMELAEARRSHPHDDLMTALVEAEIDGERLTNEEIAAFFNLLAVAGNDTTRHTTSHAAKALDEHPDQRSYLLEDVDGRLPTAVEEFVRWATAVSTFRRTATRDTELGGAQITAGEKVVLFYRAGNRDETAFEHADRFDVSRSPNYHLGFGGGGIHYCLGASLARTQLRCIFHELLTRAPGLTLGEPVPMVSSVINGVKRMPFVLEH